MSILTIIVLVWVVGFIGAVGVVLKDYQSYKRDVLLTEFLIDMLIVLITWPCIIHYIIQYTYNAVISIFGLKPYKFKIITIFKYKGKDNE
jgi:hypothetical protein